MIFVCLKIYAVHGTEEKKRLHIISSLHDFGLGVGLHLVFLLSVVTCPVGKISTEIHSKSIRIQVYKNQRLFRALIFCSIVRPIIMISQIGLCGCRAHILVEAMEQFCNIEIQYALLGGWVDVFLGVCMNIQVCL